MTDWTDWQKFFIDRPQAEKYICNWLEDPNSKQVLSLVAPPAWGKTWLLHYIQEQWEKDGAVAVWIHIPDLVKEGSINVDSFMGDFKEKAKARGCQKIKNIDSTREFTARLETFMEYVCSCNFKKPPLVLVDGYDEVSEVKMIENISLKVLDKLIEKKRCAKLIIARRVGFAIKGVGIRLNQKDFPLHGTDKVTQNFAKEQYKKLFADKFPHKKVPNPQTWMTKPKHYQWNHPFANEILFKKGISSTGSLKSLTAQDYFECGKKIIERPDQDNIPRIRFSKPEFENLYKIANNLRGQNGWTQEEAQNLLCIPNIQQYDAIKRFIEYGLIVWDASQPPLYNIVGGLRELLREFDINKIQFDI